MEGSQQGIKQFANRAIGQSNINATNLATYPIPLPSLVVQQAMVAEIEAEQALVAASRELIARFEKKSNPPSPASGMKECKGVES